MLSKVSVLSLIVLLSVSGLSFAQTLDGSPYTPGKDPDIDLYINSCVDSDPLITHGALVERNILTQGDPMNPPAKGAVLKNVKSFTHATLPPKTSTRSTKLENEQEIFYILSGKGTIKAGGKEADLYSGIAVIMPADRSFTITNDSDEPLTMYLISEPTPEGFKPLKNMVVKDENTIPIRSTTGHWCHIVKNIFSNDEGMATVSTILTVRVDPMTMPHPHSHGEGLEEFWTAIAGTSIAFLGKQIRMQSPGTGYLIPPDGNTPHSNINTSDKQVKFLYVSSRY